MTSGLPLIGFVVGMIVGMTSTGGGALLTPALVLILGVPPSLAIGSDVLIASGMKLVGGGFYAIRRQVHWRVVWSLALGSIPGALLGVFILNQIPAGRLEAVLSHCLGGVLVLAGAATGYRAARRTATVTGPLPSTAGTAALGLATGLLVSMTSVGSGSLLLCVLTAFFPLGAQTLVGTDLVHALLLSATATAGHYLSGRVNVPLAVGVLAGAIPGVLVGARLAMSIPDRKLRLGLAGVLLVVGLELAVGR